MKEHIPTAPLTGKILLNTESHNYEFKELEWAAKQVDAAVVMRDWLILQKCGEESQDGTWYFDVTEVLNAINRTEQWQLLIKSGCLENSCRFTSSFSPKQYGPVSGRCTTHLGIP